MQKSIRQKAAQRKGAALVEFAVCIPVIMILILGSIEATSAIFLKQSLTTAAYEGIRESIRRGATTTDATNKATNILNQRRVRDFDITFNPPDVESLDRGTIITIEINAPIGNNSPFIGKVIPDRELTVRTVMVKE